MKALLKEEMDTRTAAAAVIMPAVEEAAPVPVRPPRPVPTLNDIHRRAWQKWEQAGCPSGDNLRFWLEAEQELLHEG